jgi:predicted amidohydrolase
MKVACCQFAPIYRDVEKNLDIMRNMLLASDADLCIFPELATTGYFFRTQDEVADIAEALDGNVVKALQAMALESGKALITGFLESSEGKYFNSALAIGADGKIAGHYRKVHLFYYEKQVFTTGDLGFPVFDLRTDFETARVGMMICYDWRFPEAARALALAGAELIAVPSNIVTTTGMLHTTLATRAFENKVALAFVDRIGIETNGDETLSFRGESALFDLNGQILSMASADRQQIITATVDPAKTRSKQINEFNDIFGDRQPAAYDSIATQRASAEKINGEKKS